MVFLLPGFKPVNYYFLFFQPHWLVGIKAKFQLLLSGHSCGAISRSGDYQYKGSGGREIDPGLEAGRWSRALAGNSSGSSPYPLSVWQYWVPPLHWACWPTCPVEWVIFLSKCKAFYSFSKLHQCIFKYSRSGQVLIMLMSLFWTPTKTGCSHRLWAFTHVL